MSDLFDQRADPSVRYRRPEDEAYLPGYVTVLKAAQIVCRALLPSTTTLGPLDDLIPCQIFYDGEKPAGVSRLRVIGRHKDWKAVRVSIRVDNIIRDKLFIKWMRLTRRYIFALLFENQLNYHLMFDGQSIINRPSTRATIYNDRRFAFETGFVKWTSKGTKSLRVLLISQKSLDEHAILRDIKKVFSLISRRQLRARDFEIIRLFLTELKSQAGDAVRFTKEELFEACRSILSKLEKVHLQTRVFESLVWENKAWAGLRIGRSPGKQPQSRVKAAESAIKVARHKVLASHALSTGSN